MKTGLVLEGGAMRGLFTCGVIDLFMEENIVFDGAAGISAGATFGCNLKSLQPGRALRYNKKYGKDPRYCSVRSFLKTGDLYGADFCYRELPDILDPFDRKTFRENPMEFYVGATDVITGKPLFHRCTDGGREDMAWIRASASMPIVSRPVEAGGHLLLDGGIVDPVPYRFMEDIGYDRNVAILTQPKGYRKKKNQAAPAMKLLLLKYPKIAEIMAVRYRIYNQQMEEIEKREKNGTMLVIRPPKALSIARTEGDPEELERVYDIGRETGKRCLDAVKSFLLKAE